MQNKSLAKPVNSALFIESDAGKALVDRVAESIYNEHDGFGFASREASKAEIATVYALVKAMDPHDIVEALAAVQVVACQLLGMRKISMNSEQDQAIGVKLLKIAGDSLERLEKKRDERITMHFEAA